MNMLFAPPVRDIVLRQYQADAVQRLREGIAAGARRQILVAPTAAGKTEMAMEIIQGSQRKNARAWFVVDRKALIEQTSERFASYGIDHGVIQADHFLTDYAKPVQIASAQTLARRNIRMLPDLIVWDECHSIYASVLDLVGRAQSAKVIGLTATPFTSGMADHWDGLVNSTTVNKLLEQKFLTPLKIKACVAPDMTGAKIRKGEYAEEDAADRGITIIGDVVQTWIEQTRKHFGGPVKTIVFSPSVKHGAELCRHFAEAGFNFQQISYLDKDEGERRAKIAEFRKPDSAIHGLVSCAVLTKGFDVSDVKCIAEGQRVLTDKGLVSIERVTLEHKLWDGIEYVSHQGVIFKGYQHVIEHAGLVATEDHEVHTAQGWRSLGDCSTQQIPITQTGFGRSPIRSDAGHFAQNYLAKEGKVGSRSYSMLLRRLRKTTRIGLSRTACCRQETWVQGLLSEGRCGSERSDPAMAGVPGRQHESALREIIAQGVSKLRWTRHRISICVSEIMRGMGYREPWLAQAGQQHAIRSHRQQWPLRTWQSSLGVEGIELQQHAAWRARCQDASVSTGASRNSVCGQNPEKPLLQGDDLRTDCRAVSPSIGQAKRPVWDILQAGPRNRFTCEGLLVHNCGISCRPYRKSFSSHIQEMGRVMRIHPGKEYGLWLDHSSNAIRFADDTAWLFEYGVDSLSDAAKRDSEVREPLERVKRERFCGECGMQMQPSSPVCPSCGWERPQRGEIQIVQGELIDFEISTKEAFQPRSGLRAECLKDPRGVHNAALAYCMANSRRGEEAARKWAYGIWAGIYPGAKLPRGLYDVPCNHAAVTPDQWSLVEREILRFRKTRKAA